jgi:hypothetical protein
MFNLLEILFVVLVVLISSGVFFAKITIENLIEINGAVIGFFFIYFIPAVMHFKCLYITKKPIV